MNQQEVLSPEELHFVSDVSALKQISIERVTSLDTTGKYDILVCVVVIVFTS